MTLEFRQEIREERESVKREEWLSADVGSYRVLIIIDDAGHTRVTITPKDWDYLRMGILDFHPRNVSDIEKFAEDARELLISVADGLRKAGKIDLRSRWERIHDGLK